MKREAGTRVQMVFPSALLKQIDDYAGNYGLTRSGAITHLLLLALKYEEQQEQFPNWLNQLQDVIDKAEKVKEP